MKLNCKTCGKPFPAGANKFDGRCAACAYDFYKIGYRKYQRLVKSALNECKNRVLEHYGCKCKYCGCTDTNKLTLKDVQKQQICWELIERLHFPLRYFVVCVNCLGDDGRWN